MRIVYQQRQGEVPSRLRHLWAYDQHPEVDSNDYTAGDYRDRSSDNYKIAWESRRFWETSNNISRRHIWLTGGLHRSGLVSQRNRLAIRASCFPDGPERIHPGRPLSVDAKVAASQRQAIKRAHPGRRATFAQSRWRAGKRLHNWRLPGEDFPIPAQERLLRHRLIRS